jgi:hypothetical protein
MSPCFGLVCLLLVIFWFVQLVDVLGRRDVEFRSPTDRVIWVLVILLLPVLGAILYFFMKPVKSPKPFEPLPGTAALERDLDEMRKRMEGENKDRLEG